MPTGHRRRKSRAVVSRSTARSHPAPLLLNNLQAATLIGVGINRFYALRLSDPEFPPPVELPCTTASGRTKERRSLADLQAYVALLSERARQRKTICEVSPHAR